MNDLQQETAIKMRKYWEFSDKMERIFCDIYGNEYIEKMKLPIDIKSVAKKMGYTIVKGKSRSNKYYGVVHEKVIEIYEPLCYQESRWTIAKAIVIENGMITNPLWINNDPNMLDTDVFAMLMLLPVFLFKKELAKYIADNKSDYFEKLRDISQIPMIQLGLGYNAISQMLYFQRWKEFEECGYDIAKVQTDEFEEIFI